MRSMFCAAGATLLLLTVGSAPIRAQSSPKNVVVRATVRDESSGRPLSGARVEFNGLNRRTLTDDGGEFEFVGIPIGSHVLWADQYGYSPLEATMEVGGEVPMSIEVPSPPLYLRRIETSMIPYGNPVPYCVVASDALMKRIDSTSSAGMSRSSAITP